jgi:hypothetical protein
MLRTIAVAVVTSWALLLRPVGLPAQNDPVKAHLEIAVTDVTGAIVAGADIRISRVSDTAQPILETDKEGHLLVDVAPGSYDVSADSPGFRRSKQQIELSGSEVRSVSFKLTVDSCPPGPCLTVTAQREPTRPPVSIRTPPPEALPALCKGKDFTQTGVPLFSGDHADGQYGISLPRTQFDPSYIPLRIWVDNESAQDLTLGACSMFMDWNVDVWDGAKRILNHREQRDGKRWFEGSDCAAEPVIKIKAHSCSVMSKIDMGEWYSFPSSIYTAVARTKYRDISSKPPRPADGLEFRVEAP